MSPIKFIDPMIIILAFTPNDKREECRDMLRRGGIVNTLALIEAYYNIENITKNKVLAKRVIKSILNKLEIVSIDHNLLFEALRRVENYGLKIFDLIHYTTALLKGCSAIISYDKHFDNLEIKREEP